MKIYEKYRNENKVIYEIKEINHEVLGKMFLIIYEIFLTDTNKHYDILTEKEFQRINEECEYQ